MGQVNMATVQNESEGDPDEEKRKERIKHQPILESCYNARPSMNLHLWLLSFENGLQFYRL